MQGIEHAKLNRHTIQNIQNETIAEIQDFIRDKTLADFVDSTNLPDVFKYSFRYWWTVQTGKWNPNFEEKVAVYEEALKNIPGSYKLWHRYQSEGIEWCESKCILCPDYEVINENFERSLVYMHKMPRIWLLYYEFLKKQKKIRKIRQVLDRALQALPVTQHEKIWEEYSNWAMNEVTYLPLSKYIIDRYCKINQDFQEDYANFLKEQGEYDEYCSILVKLIDDEYFSSKHGKSKFDICIELCTEISKHSDKIKSIDGETIIRHCITKYTDEVGNLWVSLADFFIIKGAFDKGRDIFEEALEQVVTARDFGIVYNAYMKFEEELLMVVMEEAGDTDVNIDDKEQNLTDDFELIDKINRLLNITDESTQDIQLASVSQEELVVKRVENLMERREILLNSCLLRQNENNANEWKNRLLLLKKDNEAYLRTFHEALTTINPMRTQGKVSEIWSEFANFYEEAGDILMANKIYNKATISKYRNVEELSNIWILWCEMLLRSGAYQDALAIIRYPLMGHSSSKFENEQKEMSESQVYSTKMWSLCVDLELNFGTFETIKAAYRRMMDLRIITPKNQLNFTHYLEKHDAYEESFRVYETGLNLFRWPSLFSIWVNYLKKLTERYGDDKLERLRDLYEKVIKECPKDRAKQFYIMYSEMEENFGQLNHSIEILDRMVDSVELKQKPQAFNLYIAKVTKYLGVTRTRPIYKKALETLKAYEFLKFGIRFANLEKKLGEIDRSRQIFGYISQAADPNIDEFNFWNQYEEFEIACGNEDTFKEMMRQKRSTETKFNMRPPTLDSIEAKIKKEETDAEKLGKVMMEE